MRMHGNLIRWNDERGFGFIRTAKSDGELFVHVSAFPHDGRRPQVGELISFEVESGPDGRQRAMRVMRPGQAAHQRATPAGQMAAPRGRNFGRSLTTLAVVMLALYAYDQYESRSAPDGAQIEEFSAPSEDRYSCDGRNMCSQMTSCAEATYFLQNCPGPQMDGDGDGVPCESQWCN